MADTVSTDQVVAFRIAAHGLTERSGPGGPLDAAGRCGVQNSPPGSALLALHARVRDITQDRMAALVAEDRSLLQTWSLRGAPFFFPTSDAAVFTTGVLPPTEEAKRHLVPGVAPALASLGMGIDEAVERTGAEIRAVLSGRRLAINELGAELAARIADTLPEPQRGTWTAEGPYAPGQPLGEGVVHFCIRILTLQRVVCFGPRTGAKAPFVLADEWLPDPVPDTGPEPARAELLRRYLRCYGPSTREGFAAWAGIRPGDTGPWWTLVEDELAPVDFGGTAWVRADDLDALRSAPAPEGVRLLPPRDPYTQVRDRATIVAPEHHRDVWRTLGEPGTVLADGAVIGVWRPRKRGRRLSIAVTAFRPLTGRDRDRVAEEAERIAPLRGAASVSVAFDTG